jgi:hypothetical protein
MPKNKGGRPTKSINLVELSKLCAMQCTEAEIAGWFDVSVDTIERRVQELTGMSFADYFKQKRGRGKVSIRRKQMQMALDGNVTMLIWLGKQYLEQKDKQDIEHSGNLSITFAKELQGV